MQAFEHRLHPLEKFERFKSLKPAAESTAPHDPVTRAVALLYSPPGMIHIPPPSPKTKNCITSVCVSATAHFCVTDKKKGVKINKHEILRSTVGVFPSTGGPLKTTMQYLSVYNGMQRQQQPDARAHLERGWKKIRRRRRRRERLTPTSLHFVGLPFSSKLRQGGCGT